MSANNVTEKVSRSNLTFMQSYGVIDNRSNWRFVKARYINDLFTKAAADGVMHKRTNNGVRDVETALDILVDAGVVNTPEYWRNLVASDTVQNLSHVLVNIANKCRIVLEKIIHAEACGEGLDGQILVGNVVLNRCKNKAFPDGIYNVVFQKNQFAPTVNGAYQKAAPSASVKQAVTEILCGMSHTQDALYFCSIASAAKPDSWHERALEFLFECGGHRFYR